MATDEQRAVVAARQQRMLDQAAARRPAGRRNLIGLLYLRTSGNDDDLANVRRLHEHWRQLGRDVPMFAVNAEPLDRVEHWTPEGSVDLRQWPYGLEQLLRRDDDDD